MKKRGIVPIAVLVIGFGLIGAGCVSSTPDAAIGTSVPQAQTDIQSKPATAAPIDVSFGEEFLLKVNQPVRLTDFQDTYLLSLSSYDPTSGAADIRISVASGPESVSPLVSGEAQMVLHDANMEGSVFGLNIALTKLQAVSDQVYLTVVR